MWILFLVLLFPGFFFTVWAIYFLLLPSNRKIVYAILVTSVIGTFTLILFEDTLKIGLMIVVVELLLFLVWVAKNE